MRDEEETEEGDADLAELADHDVTAADAPVAKRGRLAALAAVSVLAVLLGWCGQSQLLTTIPRFDEAPAPGVDAATVGASTPPPERASAPRPELPAASDSATAAPAPIPARNAPSPSFASRPAQASAPGAPGSTPTGPDPGELTRAVPEKIEAGSEDRSATDPIEGEVTVQIESNGAPPRPGAAPANRLPASGLPASGLPASPSPAGAAPEIDSGQRRRP